MLPQVATEQALLETIEDELLNPGVIARTIEKAVAALTDTGSTTRQDAPRRDLATTEAQTGRVTQAIVLGGALDSLVTELKRLEARRVASLQSSRGWPGCSSSAWTRPTWWR
jgi:hypothetical protein